MNTLLPPHTVLEQQMAKVIEDALTTWRSIAEIGPCPYYAPLAANLAMAGDFVVTMRRIAERINEALPDLTALHTQLCAQMQRPIGKA